jgi:MoxR-like ATPase
VALPKGEPLTTATQKAPAHAQPLDQDVQQVVAKMRDAFKEDTTRLIERATMLELLWLSLISRTHGELISEAGEAKTTGIKTVVAHFADANYFEKLMRKALDVQELYGPISATAIKNDEFYFNTKGMQPEAHVVFKDEFYRAAAAVLTTDLTMMVDREFHNGTKGPLPVPMWSLFAAANTRPLDEELTALQDRFGWSYQVPRVTNDDSRSKIIDIQIDRQRQGGKFPTAITISHTEMERVHEAVVWVDIPQDVKRDFLALLRRANEEQMFPSTRRMGEMVKLLQARALWNGRDAIISDDLTILQHSLWDREEDAIKAGELVLDYAGIVQRKAAQLRRAFEPYKNELNELKPKVQSEEQSQGQISTELAGQVARVQMNLNNISKQVEKQIADAESDKHDASELHGLLAEVKASQKVIRDDILGGGL